MRWRYRNIRNYQWPSETDKTSCDSDSVSPFLFLPGVKVIQLLPEMISESECAIINNTLHPQLSREGTETFIALTSSTQVSRTDACLGLAATYDNLLVLVLMPIPSNWGWNIYDIIWAYDGRYMLWPRVFIFIVLKFYFHGRNLFCCPESYYQNREELEGDPMIYIVTMLVVFSAGIASLMMIYMKKVFYL